MKTKKYILILLSFLFAFYACSEDSVSIIDVNPPADPEPEQPAPDEPEYDSALFGSWVLDPTAGALGVGPAVGDYSWWSNSAADVTARDCLFDDLYVFNQDGTFQNILGDQTWLETWQGVGSEGCGTPVQPHDGSTVGEWSVSNGSLIVSGEGVYLGLAKVHNTGEDGKPANNRITYKYEVSSDGTILELTITGWLSDNADAAWYFRFTNLTDDEPASDAALIGSWALDPSAGALAVGPNASDFSWWSNSAADVTARDCLFDDLYIFNEDGTFQNELGEETWLETWQGVGADGCGVPVAPHDGATVGTWSTADGAVTVTGSGLYLGLSKVHNNGEDGSPANDTINYNYELSDDDQILEIKIDGWLPDVPEATWYFRFARQE
jgi:hypothetical protein